MVLNLPPMVVLFQGGTTKRKRTAYNAQKAGKTNTVLMARTTSEMRDGLARAQRFRCGKVLGLIGYVAN